MKRKIFLRKKKRKARGRPRIIKINCVLLQQSCCFFCLRSCIFEGREHENALSHRHGGTHCILLFSICLVSLKTTFCFFQNGNLISLMELCIYAFNKHRCVFPLSLFVTLKVFRKRILRVKVFCFLDQRDETFVSQQT